MNRPEWVHELDRRRLALGLGAAAWAAMADVSITTVTAILTGKRIYPDMKAVSRLAAVVDAVVLLVGGAILVYDADQVSVREVDDAPAAAEELGRE